MAGFVLMALTTTITAVLRGVGDSKTAMKYNVAANVINIILNWILIYGNLGFPKMGVAGASLATVIGQTAAFFMAGWALMKKGGYLEFNLREKFKPDREILTNIFCDRSAGDGRAAVYALRRDPVFQDGRFSRHGRVCDA